MTTENSNYSASVLLDSIGLLRTEAVTYSKVLNTEAFLVLRVTVHLVI